MNEGHGGNYRAPSWITHKCGRATPRVDDDCIAGCEEMHDNLFIRVEPMTEPSQEAVELARTVIGLSRLTHGGARVFGEAWCECDTGFHPARYRIECEVCMAVLVDAALRKERLETLERAAKEMCARCRTGKPDSIFNGMPYHSRREGRSVTLDGTGTCHAGKLWLLHASLQPREAKGPVAQESRSAEWRTHGEQGRPQNHPQGAEIEARESASRSVSDREAGSSPAGATTYHPTAVAVTLVGLIREHLKNCLRTIRGVDCPDLLYIVDEWAQKVSREPREAPKGEETKR